MLTFYSLDWGNCAYYNEMGNNNNNNKKKKKKKNLLTSIAQLSI